MSWLLVSILAPALSVSLGDRSELRLRNGDTTERYDLITAPRLTLDLKTYRSDWMLAYVPVVTQLSLGRPDEQTLLIQSGSLLTNIVLSRRTRIRMSEFGSYGRQNFRVLGVSASDSNPSQSGASGSGSPLQSSTTSTGCPLAAQASQREQTVRYGSLSASGGVVHRFEPRWEGSLSATGLQSGGLDALSQSMIPRTRQFMGGVSLAHAASSRDGLGLRFDGLVGNTQPGTTAFVLSGELSWSRRFSRAASGSLTVGNAYAKVEAPGQIIGRDLPVAGASLELSDVSQGRRNSVSLTESYAPFIDRILGTISERATTMMVAQTSKSKLTLQVAMYGIASTLTVGRVSLLGAFGSTESASYALDRHWIIEVGAREAWQDYANVPQQPFLWSIYSAVTFTTGALPL